MNNEIYIGQAINYPNTKVYHSFSETQKSLAIVGSIGAGKSNLLRVILKQYKGEKYVIDTLAEIEESNAVLISESDEIIKFLEENASGKWTTERLVIIDEISDLLRGKGNFQQQCRNYISQMIRKARHYNLSFVACTQLPDYKSWGSDDTIRLLIRSWIRLNLPNKTDFSIENLDLSQLETGQALYTAPALKKYNLNGIFIKIPHHKEIEDENLKDNNNNNIIDFSKCRNLSGK